ncbi:M23 family metallopeptidase [Celeribacter arenosi]|uniref:M23 family metallopeptidase n=1 Tax=Celeribacter arenosi TaxID=792649 RepID=A0ABP7K379_9RHOB
MREPSNMFAAMPSPRPLFWYARVLAAVFTAIFATAPAMAKEPILNLPVDCALGSECYIQHYVDTDPSHGGADFTCGPLSYDGNIGTDFALPTVIAMWRGIDVLSAAPGTVLAIRDGMEDFPQGTEGAPDVSDQSCGNGVVVDHGGGWSSQYCHLMNGSVAVQSGQRVPKGGVLGQIGLSGRTDFPHLHFVLRHEGRIVDPFNPDAEITCGAPAINGGTLWQKPMVYQPGGLLTIGVTDTTPTLEIVRAGTADKPKLAVDAPAIILFTLLYGAQKDDVLRLWVAGPDGELFSDSVTIEETATQIVRASGRKIDGAWRDGGYRAQVQFTRNGQVIGQMSKDFTVE